MVDLRDRPLVETGWLAEHLDDPDLRIVDARWRGEGTSRQLYMTGHIPGADHLHSVDNLDPDQNYVYLTPADLRARAELIGLQPEQRVITYCGVGISGSLGLFALHLAGFKNLALYDASWSEWGTDPWRPVERD